MNIIINVAYLISGIYTNFCTFLCRKCDVGYYAINHGVIDICSRRSCVIKFLRQNKGQALGKRISVKNWKIGGLYKLLKKIDDMDSDTKHFMFTSQVMKLMITG